MTHTQSDAELCGPELSRSLHADASTTVLPGDLGPNAAIRSIETALATERNFVAAVLDTVGAMVAVFDVQGRIVRFNRACEAISGYRCNDLIGEYAWERLIPEDEIPQSVANFERLCGGAFPADYDETWITARGEQRHIRWSATALVDERGQVTYVIATGIDRTQQRDAQTAAVASEGRYRQIVEATLGMVITHDAAGRLLTVNNFGADMLGFSQQAMLGRFLAEFVVQGSHDSLGPYFEQLLSVGEAAGLMSLRTTQGKERVVAYRSRWIEATDGAAHGICFGVDITEQVQAEQQLRELTRQSSSVLDSVGEGILALDLEGRITVANAAAAQMLGYSQVELLGRDLHTLVQPARADGSSFALADSPIERSARQLATMRTDGVFRRHDGTTFPVEYVVCPQIVSSMEETRRAAGDRVTQVQNDRPRPGDICALAASGVVIAFCDITQRLAMQQLKDEFISTISHELRTPLTAMRAALGLVAGGALAQHPEKATHMLQMALGNTDRLVRLVNDVLELERIGSGRCELHWSECALGDLIERAVALLETSAAKANVRLVVEAGDATLYADGDRIQQTLTNLLSNAIKFSPGCEGKPAVVRVSARSLSSDEVLIEVADEGCGIPEDQLHSVFERFHQVDAAVARAKGGTGLGLAICRSIVAQHAGTIWATSELGVGSTFHIKLPVRPPKRISASA